MPTTKTGISRMRGHLSELRLMCHGMWGCGFGDCDAFCQTAHYYDDPLWCDALSYEFARQIGNEIMPDAAARSVNSARCS